MANVVPVKLGSFGKGREIVQMTPRGDFVEEFPSIVAAYTTTSFSKYQITQILNLKGDFNGTETFFWLDKSVYDDLHQSQKESARGKSLPGLQNQITIAMLNFAARRVQSHYGRFIYSVPGSDEPPSPDGAESPGLLSEFKQVRTTGYVFPPEKMFIYDYLENRLELDGKIKEPAVTTLDPVQMAEAQSLFVEALRASKDFFQTADALELFIARFTRVPSSNPTERIIGSSNPQAGGAEIGRSEVASSGLASSEAQSAEVPQVQSPEITVVQSPEIAGARSPEVLKPRSPHIASGGDSTSIVQLTTSWEYVQYFPSVEAAAEETGISTQQIRCVLEGDAEEKLEPCLWMSKRIYDMLDKDEEIRPILQLEILPALHQRRGLIGEYPSVAAASRLTGIPSIDIERSLRGQIRYTDDFVWRDKMLKAQPAIRIDPPKPSYNTPSDLRVSTAPSPANPTADSSTPGSNGLDVPGAKGPEPISPLTEKTKAVLARMKTEFNNLFSNFESKLRRHDYETHLADRTFLTELEDQLTKIRIQAHFLKFKGDETLQAYYPRITDFEKKVLHIGKGLDEYERLEASFQTLNTEDSETPVRRSPRGEVSKASRMEVWDAHIGVQTGQIKCPNCKVNFINPFHFHLGHVIPRSKGGGDTVQNLRPICSVCNQSMGAHPINLSKYRVELHRRNPFSGS